MPILILGSSLSFMNALKKAKPASAKGIFIKKIRLV